jgi:NAD(P)-dependent dehydrogenase (short-subunit alcohol dehydrogenase family)
MALTLTFHAAPGPCRYDPFVNLRGQAALITGGGGGIGSACAQRLARDGAAVLLMGRTAATLDAARQRITAATPDARIECFAGDALDERALAAAFETTTALADRVTMAVAVVGGGMMKPLLAFEVDEFVEQLRRNTVSAFSVIRQATPHLTAAGGGSIVCISSVAARLAYPFMTPYSAAKHAVEGLVRGAALELAPLHVRVNAVRAGLIRSDATGTHLRENADVIVSERPLSRVGEPSDVAEAVRFLAGPESGWVTGQSIAVDGGTELTKAPRYLEAVTRRRVGDDVVDAALGGSTHQSLRRSSR